MVAVFDFRLRQRGRAGNGPVDGLFGAVDEVLFDKAGKGFQFGGLVFRLDGPVFIVPVAEHAEALELLGLDLRNLSANAAQASRTSSGV